MSNATERSSSASDITNHPPRITPLERLLGPFTRHLSARVTVEEQISSPSYAELRLVASNQTVQRRAPSCNVPSVDKPQNYLEWIPRNAENSCDLHFLGFQCSEFAQPVRAHNADLQFNWFCRPAFWRPRSVFPLFVFSRSTTHTLLLAPVNNFHEQVLVPCTRGYEDTSQSSSSHDNVSCLRWGWSGDLEHIPEGFGTTLLIIAGDSPRALIEQWGARIRDLAGVVPRGPYSDICMSNLSMWTDNGSAYWYRKEPGKDLPQSLELVVSSLRKNNVPIAAIELDSWFYPHQVTRNISEIGYLDVVPPTGMIRWEPRQDVLGLGGITALRRRLGNPPLILHSRHISSQSDYVPKSYLTADEHNFSSLWWIDGERAHPVHGDLFERWMQQAVDWGATAYEQDWMVEVWLGVRQLRVVPGRITAWQHALNRAAASVNLSLIWCMATPADMAAAASLSQIAAVRSSDDYRYAEDPSVLWRWHLTVNCLVRALGLWPFKDVFMSCSTNESGVVDIDGDPNAELEALLSALSGGPVGIGDRAGRTDRSIIMRTCRSDGVLVKPDVPLAAMDRSLFSDPSETPLVWADTYSGEWQYIVVIHAGMRSAKSGDLVEDSLVEETLEFDGGTKRLVYDWRSAKVLEVSTLTVSLRTHEWKLFIVCPTPTAKTNNASSPVILIGDIGLYATMGQRRIRILDKERHYEHVDVVGQPGEQVCISAWSSETGLVFKDVVIPERCWTEIDLNVRSWRCRNDDQGQSSVAAAS